MSVICAILLSSMCTSGDYLDEARVLLRKGLLRQAEQRLATLLTEEADTQRRAQMLLLLGNVDYERGLYAQAVELYVQAEHDAMGEPSVVEAASGNRVMAEQRLTRSRVIEALAIQLRSAVAATVVLSGLAVAWLARQSRSSRPGDVGSR